MGTKICLGACWGGTLENKREGKWGERVLEKKVKGVGLRS